MTQRPPAGPAGHRVPARRWVPARRLTVLVSEHDRAGHATLWTELVKRARRLHVLGVTVFEGVEGFGRSGRSHHMHLVTRDAPLAVVLVDGADRIDEFIARVAPLLAGATVLLDDIEILRTDGLHDPSDSDEAEGS